MKIHEYNEMMSYLTRPAQPIDRLNKAIGGGAFEGEDLGTREGFNNIAKSEASFKAYEDRFGKEILDKAAQDKYGKNFRDLDKKNELKFFKTQLNKYEDFIKKNKRYPSPSEAYSIGLEQSGKPSTALTEDVKTKIKDIYTSGEGGSTYISKKLAEEVPPVNIDDSTIRRFITAEEEAGNIVRPKKFKTQEADPDIPKDRYNKIREVTERDLKGFTVGRTGTSVKAPSGSKYKIVFNTPGSPETSKIPSGYQGTKYYRTKEAANKALAGYNKWSTNFAKQRKQNRSPRAIILDQVSDRNIEADIGRLKTFEDLATAHRLSYKQVGKLNELYNVLNLGVEDPTINSGAVRKFENKLDNLYQEQRNLIKTAKRYTNKGENVPLNLQKKIDFNNKKISTVVDLTDNRIQGILVNTKNLKPYVYGVDYLKTYGMGMLKSKNVKDLTDADLATIELNLKNQIDQERKVAGKDFDLLKDRQKFLKNVDELSGPQGAQIAEKLGLFETVKSGKINQLKNIKGITTADQASMPEKSKQRNMFKDFEIRSKETPPEFDANRALIRGLGEAVKYVPTPAGIIGLNLGLRTDPTETLDRVGLGIEAATLPSVVKFGNRLTAGNPMIQKFFNLGMTPANAMRLARFMQPIGVASLAGEGLYRGAKYMIDRNKMLQSLTDEQRDELLAREKQEAVGQMRRGDAEAFDYIGAANGGRIGFADGPDDPSKRKFMKVMGGLTALPFVGKFFKIAEPLAPAVSRAFDSMPDFLTDLIAKVKAKAEATGMKFFSGKSADEFADVYKADGYTVTEQGNRVTVTKRKEQGDMLEKDMEMELEVDPETGGMTYKEATARPDAEGKLKDVEESIDDIDLEEMKKYTYDE